MDYKALVARGKYVGGRVDSGLEREVVFALCDAVEALEKEAGALRAARVAYASEFPTVDGEPDVGSIHAHIRRLKGEVTALEKDANRWRWYATSPQTALMLGSKLDPNSEQDWVAENGRLADIIMRDAFYQAIEASTPTPAAPSDA